MAIVTAVPLVVATALVLVTMLASMTSPAPKVLLVSVWAVLLVPKIVEVVPGSVNVRSVFVDGELIVKIPVPTGSPWSFIIDMAYSYQTTRVPLSNVSVPPEVVNLIAVNDCESSTVPPPNSTLIPVSRMPFNCPTHVLLVPRRTNV